MTEPKFMTPAHRRAYLTHLNRCKAMDSYHRALIYILTAVPALRNNIESCFDFEKDEIKPESLAAGWQTGGTVKLTRFAYPDADDDEIAVIRRRWQPYLDLLPQYRSSCRAFHIAE